MGYRFGDTGGGAVMGAASGGFAGARFSFMGMAGGGGFGAMAGADGTMFGGFAGGAADGFFNGNRGHRIFNPNSWYGSGFGRFFEGGVAGMVGGFVNDYSGQAVDLFNKEYGDCDCYKSN